MQLADTPFVPPPKQPPWIKARVGTGQVSSRRIASAVRRLTLSFSAGDWLATPVIHERSAPAWKCLPLPRSTTMRRCASRPSASMASCRPWIRSPL